MQNLKNKTIGNNNITLKKVPASSARKIQTLLIASAAKPASIILEQDASNLKDKSASIKLIANAVGTILSELKDSEIDELIKLSQPFILVNGELFDEDKHFDADTLFDMYEVLFFFLKETFGNFIKDALSRFQQTEQVKTALSK